MNFSDFTRWLKSDPASQDPDYQAARQSGPEFIAAAAASDGFERQLLRATRIPAPEGLADSLKALALEAPASTQVWRFRWSYAIAASLLLAASAVLVQQQLSPEFRSVEEYVAYHYSHDGKDLLGLADSAATAPSSEDLNHMLASVDLWMQPQLAGQVKFVKYCPTPEGRGIHLVMDTDQGLVTVIIMPGQEVHDGELFAFDGMEASLVSLPGRHAAAAVVGRPEQLNPAFSVTLRDAVLASATGT